MAHRDIVVIGASAGGVRALRRLAAALPPRLPATVLVVMHIGSHRSTLPAILEASGPNPATHALDGEPLLPGRIYVAPPDRHLLVEDGRARLTHGAKEHHTRPAIDPLFRSAALAYRERVIGVVLTGFLDDGTAGLQAVKQCGGLALVQDPAEAEVPDMPLGALRHVKVDHCLPLSDLSGMLVKLVNAPAPPVAAQAPVALVHEHAASLGVGDATRHLDAIGSRSTLTCPDCSGTLWELRNAQPSRYRCHTGHAYTLATLRQARLESSEAALWSALRALEEDRTLLHTAAEAARAQGDVAAARAAEGAGRRAAERVATLRRLVESLRLPGDEPTLDE